jgi:hypothetical protein
MLFSSSAAVLSPRQSDGSTRRLKPRLPVRGKQLTYGRARNSAGNLIRPIWLASRLRGRKLAGVGRRTSASRSRTLTGKTPSPSRAIPGCWCRQGFRIPKQEGHCRFPDMGSARWSESCTATRICPASGGRSLQGTGGRFQNPIGGSQSCLTNLESIAASIARLAVSHWQAAFGQPARNTSCPSGGAASDKGSARRIWSSDWVTYRSLMEYCPVAGSSQGLQS